MSEPFARPNAALCVVALTYTADLDAIDAAMVRHVEWLTEGFAQGRLLVAGRKRPRTGGVLVAIGERGDVEAWAATDPFVAGGLATAEVTAFSASFAALPLADMLA